MEKKSLRLVSGKTKDVFNQQHPVFPGGHPSKYWLDSTLLNFGDRTRTGVFNVIWPLAFEHSKLTLFVILSHVLLIEKKLKLKWRFVSFETCPRWETCPGFEVDFGLLDSLSTLHCKDYWGSGLILAVLQYEANPWNQRCKQLTWSPLAKIRLISRRTHGPRIRY